MEQICEPFLPIIFSFLFAPYFLNDLTVVSERTIRSVALIEGVGVNIQSVRPANGRKLNRPTFPKKKNKSKSKRITTAA